MEKAKLKRLDYTYVIECLGSGFMPSPALLKQPQSHSHALRRANRSRSQTWCCAVTLEAKPTPNIGVRVSKPESALTITGPSGKMIIHAPVTTGSKHDPLPLGKWAVTAVVRNPTFNYNPDLFWDADPAARESEDCLRAPTVLWEWCGSISRNSTTVFTARPSRTVGHTASHGCVRLTNWDAMTLASLVAKGSKVHSSNEDE